MHKTAIKEFITFKEIEVLKEKLQLFLKTVDKLISIKDTDTEFELCGDLVTVYVSIDHAKGAEILQVPLKRIPCWRVLFYFQDKYLFYREQKLFKELEDFLISFSDSELEGITNSMPLIKSYMQKIKDSNLKEYALIWRDHFLEENIPLLKGFETCGISPNWIFPIAKGDQTIKCERIAAYFREHKYYGVETLGNLFINSDSAKEQSEAVVGKINEFIINAQNAGKKIMIIDDGGTISNYFHDQQNKFTCAIEVTIVGIRKLKKMKNIQIPIYNLAMSDLKEIITYPEIAESCVKRIRELIPGEKIIGRPVLILGYGTSGKHVARIFRNMGAYVGVVEIDSLRLIEAAEKGFITFRNCSAGIKSVNPFLIVACTGDVSMHYRDFKLLQNGTYVTGIATKDLEALRIFPENFVSEWIPETGYIHRLNSEKYFIQLGDGQSINLYRSEAIPNRSNDIFKTAILLSASELARSCETLSGGIYLDQVNEIIKNSKLYETYYNLYFSES